MPLLVSDAMLTEIGRITVYQSEIEDIMALCIRELLRLDEGRGNILTLKMSFGERMRVLDSLLRDEFGEDHEQVQKFDDFSKQANAAHQRRNQLAHSVWASGQDLEPNTATRIKVNQSAQTLCEPVTLEDLKKQSRLMGCLHGLICDIRYYEARAD